MVLKKPGGAKKVAAKVTKQGAVKGTKSAGPKSVAVSGVSSGAKAGAKAGAKPVAKAGGTKKAGGIKKTEVQKKSEVKKNPEVTKKTEGKKKAEVKKKAGTQAVMVETAKTGRGDRAGSAKAAGEGGRGLKVDAAGAVETGESEGVGLDTGAAAGMGVGGGTASPAAVGDGGDRGGKRKGITIVSKRPAKKTKGPKVVTELPKPDRPLLGPGAKRRAPLIPSGPNAERQEMIEAVDGAGKIKSPFAKKELTRYREILIRKREELLEDVAQLETEALSSQSGGGAGPEVGDEDGAEGYEVGLSMDLAAADRKLIREIDAALARIDDGTYGICELLGRPIRPARLEELPWTRYSIDAARAIERGGVR